MKKWSIRVQVRKDNKLNMYEYNLVGTLLDCMIDAINDSDYDEIVAVRIVEVTNGN